MPDDQLEQRPDDSSAGDAAAPSASDFDNLVLDESFVRGGAYEPPARTRFAIARYGDQQTSWRHGGGLRAPGKKTPPAVPAGRPAREPRIRKSRGTNPPGAESRLPLIITAVVVIVAAFLLFR